MVVERRLESRFRSLIFNEWQRKYKSEVVRLTSFTESGLHIPIYLSRVLKIDEVIRY